jgi:hypothetical protein
MQLLVSGHRPLAAGLIRLKIRFYQQQEARSQQPYP